MGKTDSCWLLIGTAEGLKSCVMKNQTWRLYLSAVSQSFLIDRAGRKKLMGYGYLSMGIAMSVLTVMLSIKVNDSPTAVHLSLPCVVINDKRFSFHTGPEFMDPVCEHRPDLLCHLHLWTWTLWVFCCLFTPQVEHFTDLMKFFLIYFQLECLWLFLPTSSSKPGVPLLMWSVGRSAGWACSLWGCCSATLWWDTCCVSYVTLNNPYITSLSLYVIVYI